MISNAETIAPSSAPVHGEWPWWQRLGFRLSFIFWGIFCLQMGGIDVLFGLIPPAARWLNTIASAPTERMAMWLGVHLFHLSRELVQPHPTGSGDTALAYLTALAVILLAVVGTLLWTAIAELRRKRFEYRTLYAWLRLAMRFVLAATLLAYGFSKVFDLQFSPPQSYRLDETYGNSSPMALLWTFMGTSVPYTVFSGFAEVIPGMLLLFRRTSTAGAMLSSAVMLNVVMLNFCYDVPVKLYSTELLLMSLFLLLPDAAPMWRFFVLRREATLTGAWVRRAERKPLRIAAYCLQALVIGYLLYSNLTDGYRQRRERLTAEMPIAGALSGTWAVDSNIGVPPAEQWKSVDFNLTQSNGKYYIAVTQTSGTPIYYSVVLSVATHDIHFVMKQGSELYWHQEDAEHIELKGTWAGSPATMRMHLQSQQVPLLSRGFHWVQESPYNR